MKIRKDTRYVTERELKNVENRVIKLYGFSNTLESIKQQFDNFNIGMRIFNNNIKTVNKRIDKLELRLKRACQYKKWRYEDASEQE